MASPSLSATLNFVKKYPITLCGLSLFFMPSVHRLLLYFTPLLLSTAIFIVAMISWGPSASSQKSTTRRSKPKLVNEHHEWAFDESMGIDEDDGDEDEAGEGEEVTTSSHEDAASVDLRKEGTTQKDLGVDLKSREELELEPDPDLSTITSANCKGVLVDGARTVATSANCQAFEPDPDLQGGDTGTASKDGDVESVLQGGSSTHANNDGHAVHHTGGAHTNDDGDARPLDMSCYTHDDGHAGSYALHGQTGHVHEDDDDDGHTRDHHQHKLLQEGVPTERPAHCVQVCA